MEAMNSVARLKLGEWERMVSLHLSLCIFRRPLVPVLYLRFSINESCRRVGIFSRTISLLSSEEFA